MDSQNTKGNLAHQLPVGTVLHNRYEIGAVIGQGGFGITYEGYDRVTESKVAIKEYYPSGYAHRSNTNSNTVTIVSKENIEFIKNGMSRFLDEAKILAQCKDYPGVVDINDFFEENETAYIVMEFLEGSDLKHKIRKNLFKPEEIINLLWPVFDALKEIHALGIVHRDISPDNIMLLNDGSAKLMDFGAARLANYEDERSISIVLKAGYAPAEQYRKRGKQGPWTDIYALCATIYKCISGVAPDDSLEREVEDYIKKPSELGVEIDDRLERILMIGLAVNPEHRFQSVEDFCLALRGEVDLEQYELLDDDDDPTVYFESETEDGTENLQRPLKKFGKGFYLGIAAASVAVIVGLGILLYSAVRKPVTNNLPKQDTAVNTNEEILDMDVTEDAEITSEQDDRSTMYSITLTPNDDLTIEGFNNAANIIEDRIKVLCENEKYYFEIDGQNINIWVPASVALDVNDIDFITSYYIANGNNFEFLYWADHDDIPNLSVNLTNNQLINAEIKYGSIPNLDFSENSNFNPDYLNKYAYLEVTFDNDFWTDNKDRFTDTCHTPVIRLFDLNSEGVFSWNEYELHYIDECKAGIYIDKSEYKYELGMEPVEYKLLQNNLMSDNIDLSFKYEVRWNNIEWINVDESDLSGVNQCNIEEMDSDYVIMRYDTNKTINEFTDDERENLLSTLAKRLDTLESAYSIGFANEYMSRTQYVYVYYAVPFEHMGLYVANLVTTTHDYSNVISARDYSIDFDIDRLKYSFPKYENSKCLVLEYDDQYKEDLKDMTTFFIDKGIDALYLEYDSEYICKMNLTEPVTDGKLVFTELTHASNDNNDVWQWNLIESVFNYKYAINNISFVGAQFVSTEGQGYLNATEFGVSPLLDVIKVTEKIQDIAPGAKIRYSNSTDPNMVSDSEERYLYVDLNLSVNNSLPETAVEYIDNILQTMNFGQNGWIRKVEFVLSKEDEVANEYARISVNKGFEANCSLFNLNLAKETKGESYIDYFTNDVELKKNTVYLNVGNGRFEGMEDSIRALIEADEYLGSDIFEVGQ